MIVSFMRGYQLHLRYLFSRLKSPHYHQITRRDCGVLIIRSARYRFKFNLPEFVSYLGERGVLCVGNG